MSGEYKYGLFDGFKIAVIAGAHPGPAGNGGTLSGGYLVADLTIAAFGPFVFYALQEFVAGFLAGLGGREKGVEEEFEFRRMWYSEHGDDFGGKGFDLMTTSWGCSE